MSHPARAERLVNIYIYMCVCVCVCVCVCKGGSRKLVDKFTHRWSSVPSTENNINTRLAKAWIAIDRLLVILMSDLYDKTKPIFFQAAVVSVLLYGCTTWMLTKCIQKKLDSNCTRMLWAVILEATSHKAAAIQSPASYLWNHPDSINETCWILLVKKGLNHKQCSPLDPFKTTSKCWTTSKNLSSTALCCHRM